MLKNMNNTLRNRASARLAAFANQISQQQPIISNQNSFHLPSSCPTSSISSYYNILNTHNDRTSSPHSERTYSTMSQANQPAHPLTMIPGPIEFDDQVLAAMGHPAVPHTSPAFVKIFQESLQLLRTLFFSTSSTAQPFILAGSGTIGWDVVGANLIEPGENALVLNTGYFSDSFSDALVVYGANVDNLKGPSVGTKPALEDIEKALKSKTYKIVTITHVDTSTGVLSDVQSITALVKTISPQTLVVVDGVCSVAVEPIKFDDWKVDFVLTGSQKGLATPSGLSVLFASGQALDVVKARKSPIGSYFASIPRWIPIMQAYESGKGAYFATPAVQNVYALLASLRQFATSTDKLEDRFAKHKEVSDYVKDSFTQAGLKTVSIDLESSAHGMTAVYLPDGISNADLLPLVLSKGVSIAGGIHKDIATKYFRVGHMGISVTAPALGHIDKALSAILESLKELGYKS